MSSLKRFFLNPVNLFFVLFIGCKKEVKEIHFWHVMGGPLGRVLDSLIYEYNHSHSADIKSVNMGSYDAIAQKLMGAVAVNDPPVMAQMYESWAQTFYKKDQLVPISDFISDDSILNDLFPVFYKDNLIDGKLVTFPFNKSVPVFYYNKDWFDKEGIEFPKTWDDFKKISKRLTRDVDGDGEIDIYGFAFPVSVWLFESILVAKGGKIMDEKSGEVLFYSKEGIESLRFLKSFLDEDIAYLSTGYQHQDDFLSGKVAMITNTIVSYSFMRKKFKFTVGMAPMPGDKENKVIISGTNVGFFKNDKEILKKAADFLKFFLRKDVQIAWAKESFYLPVRKSVLEQAEMKAHLDTIPGLREAMAQLNNAIFEPRNELWFAGRKYLGEAIEKVLRGKLTSDQALKEAKEKIEKERSSR